MTLEFLPQQSCLGGLLYTLIILCMKKHFLTSVYMLFVFNLFVLLVVILAGKNNKITSISIQFLIFTESFNKIPFICVI